MEALAKGGAARAGHPSLPQLVGGLDLSSAHLSRSPQTAAFARMMANAEYWLSFDLASFESLLVKTPSPLRELGVAILLRFSDGVDGELGIEDLQRAQEALQKELPSELWPAVLDGIQTLERAVRAKHGREQFAAAGFKPYALTTSLSVHALRAMGRAQIELSGVEEPALRIPIGTILTTRALDERKKPLPPPEAESRIGAPLLVREDSAEHRSFVFLVPGEYVLRVPGRAAGDRKLLVA